MKNESQNLNSVPEQYTGSYMDASEHRIADAEADARALFESASLRLLSVNDWGSYAGISAFQLMDVHGIRADRQAREGDFIRIDIPGPGTNAGMGFDWVRIEQIKYLKNIDQEILSMTVRPCSHPLAKDGEVAHFFKAEATSTFIIRKAGLTVYAEEHGRNEIPNTEHGSFYDKSRNFVVGVAAKIGLSYPQWKSLIKGLLET
ncbi:MAG: hypothetical protein EOO01_19410 [Chitinophagaceae bacterium]|nr:MAG: hypothetical protein EOO01_19410 [Chitinophagaceae bacterium]